MYTLMCIIGSYCAVYEPVYYCQFVYFKVYCWQFVYCLLFSIF